MIEHTVFGLDTSTVTFFPRNRTEEVLQNVSVLLTTVVGTVPLDRNLGITATFIDEPIGRSKADMPFFIKDTIREYEPRFIVTRVDFVPNTNAAMDGKLYPQVRGYISDEQ